MDPRFSIDAKYVLKRKLSETEKVIVFLATVGKSDCRIFFFPDKNSQLLTCVEKLSAVIPDNSLLYKATDFGLSTEGVPFIVVSYEREISIRTLIGDNKPDISQLLKIGIALIEQLEFLHQNHFYNCRLIPENIYLTKSGLIRFFPYMPLDRSDLTKLIGAKQVAIESYYLPPELVRNIFLEPASDYYMLGIVLYELLTGVVPFYDKQNVEIFKQHLDSDPPIPGTFKSETHQKIFQYILPLLAKEPKNRLSELIPLKAQLFSFLKGEKRSWNFQYSISEKKDSEAAFFKKIYKDKLMMLQNSCLLLELRQGSFTYICGEEGYGAGEIIDIFIRSLNTTKNNIIYLDITEKFIFEWQGITLIALQLLEVIKQSSTEKYEDLINNNLLIEYISNFQAKGLENIEKKYIGPKFENINVAKEFIQFVREIGIWSPFYLVIENIHHLDPDSRKLIFEIGKYLPDLPLMVVVSSVEKLSSAKDIQEIKQTGLTRSQTIDLIRKKIGVDSQKAFMIYNKIIMKSGSGLFDIKSYLMWWRDNKRDDLPVPSSLFVLLKNFLSDVNKNSVNILNSLFLQPVPIPIRFFSDKQQKEILNLSKKRLLSFSVLGHEPAVKFAHSYVKKIWLSLNNEIYQKSKKKRDFLRPMLFLHPWLWINYLDYSENISENELHDLLFAVEYYLVLGCINDALYLLDKVVDIFPDMKNNLDISRCYFKIYSRLGSYEVAVKYLKKIESEVPSEKLVLTLEKISLYLKMDLSAKAENLIESITKEEELTPDSRAELNLSIGNLLAKEGNLKKALQNYQSSKNIFYENGNIQRSLKVVTLMIDIHLKMNNFNEALELIKYAHSLSLKEIDYNTMFRLLKQEGDIHYFKEDFVKAAEIYQKAFNIPIKHDSAPDYPEFLLNQGKLQWLVGDNMNALNYFSDSHKIFKEKNERTGMIRSLGSQAVIYRELGNYGTALSFEKETYELAKELNDSELEIVSMNNLGQIFTDINQLAKAKTIFLNAAKLAQQNENIYELYRSNLGLASVFIKQNIHAKVLSYIQKASQLLPQIDSLYLKNDIYYYQSRVSLMESDFVLGEENIYKFLEATKMSFKYQAMGKTLLGELKWRSHNLDEGLEILSDAFNLARLAGLDPVMLKILWLKAQIHDSKNEYPQARGAVEQSILIIYKIADSFDNEINRLMYIEALEFAEIFSAYKNR